MDEKILKWENLTGKQWWEVLGVSCEACPYCNNDGLCDAPCMVDGCFTAYLATQGKIKSCGT